MPWLFLAVCVLFTSIFLLHQDAILEWIRESIYHKIGLVRIDRFHLSYQRQRQTALIIYLKGVHLRLATQKDPTPQYLTTSHRATKVMIEFMLRFPLQLCMRLLSNRFALHLDHVVFEKKDSVWSIDHIYIDSTLNTTGALQVFSMRVQTGSINVAEKMLSFLDISSPCLVIFSCQLGSRIAWDQLDVLVQLGKVNINLDAWVKETTANEKQQKVLKSIRMTVQHVCVVKETMAVELENIDALIQVPFYTLNATSIKCSIAKIPMVSIPSIEIKVSLSANDHVIYAVPPHIPFYSITCVLHSANIYLSLDHSALWQRVFSGPPKETNAFKKVIERLPMGTIAFVLHSPSIQLDKVDTEDRCGYMTMASLIVRFSGEYMTRHGDLSASTAFNSSSSNLDAVFAKEEYQWLNAHKSNPSSQQWIDLMSRLSRRHRPHKETSHKQWYYRVSNKVILQKVEWGYTCKGKQKEFVRIKNAVLVSNMKMNVQWNSQSKLHDTLLSLENGLQTEVAIDKPMISLWHDEDDMCASVFWIKVVPHSFLKYESTHQHKSTSVTPAIVDNMSFSLDVIKGSIVMVSVDKHTGNGTPPPEGCFENTPNHQVYTRSVLDTQKFTLACQAPGTQTTDWKGRFQMENLYIQQTSFILEEIHDEERKKMHVLLWISQLNLNTTLSEGPHLLLSVKVKKYGIFYSIRNHYVCLLLARSMATMKHVLASQEPTHPATVVIETDVHVARGDIQVCLPHNTKLYVRVDDCVVQHPATSPPIIKFRNFMVLGVSPQQEKAWEQIFEIDKAQVSMHQGVELKARAILITVPYSYRLSTVIENTIGLVKAIKELHSRIVYKNLYTLFGPTLKNNPLSLPTIQIKTKSFSIILDDDPFEAKLRNILRTGLVEQQKRLAYREALDTKIQDMLTLNTDAMSFTSIRPDLSVEESMTCVDTPSPDTDVHLQIIEANKHLLEKYSDLWIKNINKTKTKESTFYREWHVRHHYRNPVTSETLDASLDEPHRLESFTFAIDILPKPLNPPLGNFTSQFVKIKVQPANFSLSETREFMSTIGGGVPLSSDFSIIIPFHLSIKAGRTWIKLRDYPLPLLYVPPLSTDQHHVAWTLSGNYVIGDELGNSGGSRIVPVTIVPSSCTEGYVLSAVRTASPLKFYSVIDYHVLTQSMSCINWSISYSPVIQDVLSVFDSLTAPVVDPSPRIGFWDKVRFMIHTQTKISFVGDFAFVVKGTRDPYQLKGRGAGLTKLWREKVVWFLGYQNPQHEFMQFTSVYYSLGVPNLAHAGFVPNLPDSMPYPYDTTEHPFLKVALKLSDGIRMGIGLSFERLDCAGEGCQKCHSTQRLDRCRSHVFSPHYQVVYQSVNQVEAFYDKNTYDAFRGFRSDFIHMSLSIVKFSSNQGAESPDFSKDDPYFMTSGSVSQNAMYLSPCFVQHFNKWFDLFGSPISLPIRQGKLFPKLDEKSPSFGDHLDTVKYKIVVNPLGLGYFCTDEETYLNVKGGGSAGLKARVNAFSVDLHSRKQVVKGSSPMKTSRTFHQIEVQLHDIDLRVTRATTSTAMEEEDDLVQYSFRWVDPKDYVILDSVPQQNHVQRQTIQVYPFVFSPMFHYVKQTDTEAEPQVYETHDCIMGKGMDSHEFQKEHLLRRASDLDKVIEHHDQQLDTILAAMNSIHHHDQATLTEQHDLLQEKLGYLRTNRYMLHNYIAQLILDTEVDTPDYSHARDSPNTTTSSIGRRDELHRWETLMGPFTDRFFIHNPQIIWNNSVRDAIYYWQDIRNNRNVQDYNLSARCLEFLENLVRTAEKQQQWKPDVPTVVMTDDVTHDQSVTEALVHRLLSERAYNFVAYNEKEEDKNQPPPNYEGIHVFEDCSDHVNDPDYQYQHIPDNYEMKSKYLIDMLNPQVNFQDEKGLDHLILFTNERIHVKAFGIIDNSQATADKDVRNVKDRIIVSLENAQLLVAKRLAMSSFTLLTQSAYGQCRRDQHWTAWVQPEHLWFYKDVRYFDNFERVASQLFGTIQLDRYNHLRIKIDKYTTSRKSPFEDRTNTMQLHFPQFKLTLNSKQAHVLYYTLIHLLLANDGSPRKKQRLNKKREVMLAAERSDLAETVKQVGILQNRSRALLSMHQKFMDQFSHLDANGLTEFNKNRKKMRQSLEKLYLVVEAIKSIQTFRQDIHLEETDNAMRFSFTSDEIVWEAVMQDQAQSSLCKWTLINTKYVFLFKQNGSSKNTIEVDDMQLQNTTDTPVFINVLDRFVDPDHPPLDVLQPKMLRGVLDSLPPVGGIPVIQQLEINLVPLQLQISTAFGSAMKDYFFPHIVTVNTTTTENEQEEDDDSVVDTLDIGSDAPSSLRNHSLIKREGSFASFDLLTQKVMQTVSRKKKVSSDELTIMKKRSSTNRTFIYVRIPAAKHCLSLQGPSKNTIYNLYNFTFEQPKLEYRNKTWSMAEMMEDIQKQFLRAILRHSPALLKNKLMSNNKQPPVETAISLSSKKTAPSITSSRHSRISLNDTQHTSYNTEEENMVDVQSLHSVDPEERVERLVKLQTKEKRLSFNVDKELIEAYLKKYKQDNVMDEMELKGKILFGDRYKKGGL